MNQIKNGTYCEKHAVWWLIVIVIIAFVLIIIIIILIISYFIVKKIIEIRRRKEQEKAIAVFKFKYSNIKSINSINNIISTNKKEITFEDEEYKKEIPVNKETKELICIANLIKDKVNLQFTKQ